MIILKITFHIIFIYCVFIDIKKRIIPESCFRLLLILGLIKSLIISNIFNMYLATSIFIFPIFLQMIIETYIDKEIIGLGDVKLLIAIALYFSNTQILFVYNFYTFMYVIAGVYLIIFRKFKGYIAFAPIIYLTFCIFDIRRY